MNAINWFEIPVVDFGRACRFYGEILATTLPVDSSFPGMQMAFLPASEDGVGGCLVACEPSKPSADGVRVYLNGGEDLAVILARVEGAGGKVVVPKTLIREDIGYFALFTDSEGNTLGLHSMH
jgi:predicted enzyme related to lactoylglutathione lyase